ncbi:hypothetical protein C8F01DRAFT_1169309 [Mycena amicta]|nr:hypothetical protein C8F01DRAFT_1169309 [Mycena amicta]
MLRFGRSSYSALRVIISTLVPGLVSLLIHFPSLSLITSFPPSFLPPRMTPLHSTSFRSCVGPWPLHSPSRESATLRASLWLGRSGSRSDPRHPLRTGSAVHQASS